MGENTKKPLTINGLSSHYGIDRRTLKKYLAHVTPVKVVGPHKLYDLDSVAEAIEAARKRPSTPKQAIEIEVLKERVRSLRRANDEAEGKLIALAEVEAFIFKVLSVQRAYLLTHLERELPAKIIGADFHTIREQMERFNDRFLQHLQSFPWYPKYDPEAIPTRDAPLFI